MPIHTGPCRKQENTKKENKGMFDAESVYNITEIAYGKTIPGDSTDYGVFVLRGESKLSHEKVLIRAIMSTDGKTFWPTATNVETEESFYKNSLLSTKDRDLTAILQKTPDGRLVVSLFYTGTNGTVVESSHMITLPVETSLRSK